MASTAAASAGKPPLMPSSSPVTTTTTTKATGTALSASANPQTPSQQKAVTKQSQVHAELEALKQRGLAKILNRHFTETTAKLEQEKAAADEALRDLERRKAQTSDFRPRGNADLSPLDRMYLSANQWRNECRRKERETLLLYQRYVNKFGSTGQVTAPGMQPYAGFLPSCSAAAKGGAAAALPPPRPPPSSSQVPNMAAEIERTLEEYIRAGALSMPSVELLGNETFESKAKREDAEFRQFYLRQLESRGVDAKACLTENQKRAEREAYTGPGFVHEEGFGGPALAEGVVGGGGRRHPLPDIHDDSEWDMVDGGDSVVSGLTEITRSVLQDCERSVAQFLNEERETIRKMMMNMDDIGEEADAMTAVSSHTELQGVGEATDQAETMVQQMQEILAEFQSKHAAAAAAAQDEDASGVMAKREPRRYETNNPDEEWMVYYDEVYQQEYYHEKKTGKTQWEPPAGGGKEEASCHTATTEAVLSHSDVMPQQESVRYESRIAQYRRKRKRAKKRKMIALVFSCVAVIGGGVWYWRRQQQQQAAVRAAKLLREQEQLRALQRQQEEARRLEAERMAREEAERKAVEELERRLALHRPFWCNIPLAYLVSPRCNRLSRENPLFDLQALISAMLQ